MSMEAGEELARKIAAPNYHSVRNAWHMLRALLRVAVWIVRGHVRVAGLTYRSVRKTLSQTYGVALLQQRAKGDLHQMEVNPSLAPYVQRELNARKVEFAREDARDGKTYIHFVGKDVDTVQHCLNQANAAYSHDNPPAPTKEYSPAPETRHEREKTQHEVRREDAVGAQSQETLSVAEGSDNPGEIGAGNINGQDATRQRPAATKTKRTRADVKREIARRRDAIKKRVGSSAPTPTIPSPKR